MAPAHLGPNPRVGGCYSGGYRMIVASKREKLGYYLFLAPAFLVFLVFIFIPMIASFVLSFFSYSMTTIKEPEFVGLKNFITLFQTPVFRTAMKNTVVYTAFTVPTTMACGLCIALLINSRLVRRKTFIRCVTTFPMYRRWWRWPLFFPLCSIPRQTVS